MGAVFGTDGARGLVGHYPITPEGVQAIVGAFAEASGGLTGQTVLVGGDTRQSTKELTDAAIEGFVSAGAVVEDLGVIPTPGLAWNLQRRFTVAGGAMVTASHNLHSQNDPNERHNGLKLFGPGGHKISDEVQKTIEEGLDKKRELHPFLGHVNPGAVASHRLAYASHLTSLNTSNPLAGHSIGIDMAHGATAAYGEKLAHELGAAKVHAIGNAPDGWNINDGYGATELEALQELVTAESLDMGVAFDGDGDRIMMVDREGRVVDGDTMAYVLARTREIGTVALTIMTNGGIVRALQKGGTTVIRTPVGDRNLLAAIKNDGAQLGAEQSGHIIDPTVGPTGDGMGTFVRMATAVKESGRPLHDWLDEVNDSLMPQRLSSISVRNKAEVEADPDVQAFLVKATDMVGKAGSVSLRPSGTEQKFRFMAEADDRKVVDALTEEFHTLLARHAR